MIYEVYDYSVLPNGRYTVFIVSRETNVRDVRMIDVFDMQQGESIIESLGLTEDWVVTGMTKVG